MKQKPMYPDGSTFEVRSRNVCFWTVGSFHVLIILVIFFIQQNEPTGFMAVCLIEESIITKAETLWGDKLSDSISFLLQIQYPRYLADGSLGNCIYWCSILDTWLMVHLGTFFVEYWTDNEELLVWLFKMPNFIQMHLEMN